MEAAPGVLPRAPWCGFRGGMVCVPHVPDDGAEEITLSLKRGTVEGRIDHAAEVYRWRLVDEVWHPKEDDRP